MRGLKGVLLALVAVIVGPLLGIGIMYGLFWLLSSSVVESHNLSAEQYTFYWYAAYFILLICLVALVIKFLSKEFKVGYWWFFVILSLSSWWYIFFQTNLFIQNTPIHNTSGSVLRDVRQVAVGLEIYNNDTGDYPTTLEDLMPNYIWNIPTQEYQSLKNCPQQNPILNYQRISEQDFKLTFCLENSTGGYSSGEHFLTKEGIK